MKNIIAFFAIVLISIPNANAQLLKKLKDKVQQSTERAVERKVDEKIEQSTEAAVDSIFESPKKIKKQKRTGSKTKQEPQTTVFPGNILSGEAKYEETYIFPVTATIEVEDVNANLKKTTMKQAYGKQALLTEMEKNGDPIIIDMKNQSAILLDINKGVAQVMSLEWMQKMMGDQSITSEDIANIAPKVKKTGKTKVMNGYTCHEYHTTYEEGSINAWYAPDVKFEYQDYLRGMAKMFSKKKEENPMQLLNTDYGYVMEMTFFNKESKKQNSMKVIALEEKVRMINMNNFKIQKQ
jgi:hypothetical protein